MLTVSKRFASLSWSCPHEAEPSLTESMCLHSVCCMYRQTAIVIFWRDDEIRNNTAHSLISFAVEIPQTQSSFPATSRHSKINEGTNCMKHNCTYMKLERPLSPVAFQWLHCSKVNKCTGNCWLAITCSQLIHQAEFLGPYTCSEVLAGFCNQAAWLGPG